MTQGPLQPGNQALPVPATQTGDLFHTFPGTGPGTSATSAFANLALETFSGPSGTGLYELPQPGAHGGGFHVECAGPRLSGEPGALSHYNLVSSLTQTNSQAPFPVSVRLRELRHVPPSGNLISMR
jgi:hypothetical protein